MKEAANDNEKISFILLAAATANVTRWLEPKKQKAEDAPDDRERRDNGERDAKADADYVDHRLRELSAFEERARGIRKR